MTAALCTENLSALAKKGVVGAFNDGAGFARVEARPPAAGIEFLTRGKEPLPTSAAGEDAIRVHVQ
jgi:hypothetical protein